MRTERPFLELGCAPNEAKRFQAASRKQINDTRLLKQQLMIDALVEMLSRVGKPVKLAVG